MSINLTGNFFANSRGLTISDGGGITWAFNKNTNTLTATAAAGSGVSPASPTAKVGAAAVNGSATTYMRSDAAPPIDLTFTPTWTGAHTFAPASGTPIAVTSAVQNGISVTGPAALNSQIVNSAVANFGAYFKANVVTYAAALFGVNDTGSLDANGIPAGGWGVGTPNGINFSIGIGGATKVTVTATGAAFANATSCNGLAPPAQSTGWGTPVGPAVVAAFPATPSLAQCGAAIGQIIAYLKLKGDFAA